MFDKQHTRRRVILGTGALAAGTIGGIAFVSDNAMATVSGDLTIPDATTAVTDATMQDVQLDATANWAYQANAPMHTVEIELHVGSTPETLDLIARQSKDDLAIEELTGETELHGSLVSASDFTIEDFQPSNGSLSTTVLAELRLYVLRDGDVKADAIAPTTFTVEVRDEELTVTPSLSGTGKVTFKTG